ncbi:RRQRL motif-containing zinc-binding protein [Streptomyces sp. NPDC057939]|uniref:RRQRL motif-containing zinc-binding protein n=1 Tax=Streptomyces sp. NPDC057939 TaxID=3346284 RepID=UPI0036E68D80
MADQDHDLVDVDPYDPGDGSLPVFLWRQAGRTDLATRRQLREMGLRPGGQEPVARIECRGGKRFAWLYRIDLAKPKFAMTLAKEAALDKAMAARQTCPGPCGRRYFHCLPLQTLGSCLECFDGTLADPAS